jgi:hypothetical protein
MPDHTSKLSFMKKILFTIALLTSLSLTIEAQRRLDFVPSRHGFHFRNAFTSHNGIVHTSGLCGGMSLAAFNFFRYNIPIPPHTDANMNFNVNFDLSLQTSGADPLTNYIFQSQIATFGNSSIILFAGPLDPDYTTEFNKAKARIDRGEYLIIGLKDRNSILGHQVLCYGYDPAGRKLFVYDPNCPDVETVITPLSQNGVNSVVLTSLVNGTEQTDHRFRAMFEEQELLRNRTSELTNYNQAVNVLNNYNYAVRPPTIAPLASSPPSAAFVAEAVYKIVNVNSGKAIEVKAYSNENGAEICQWDFHGGDNQLWKMVDGGSGYYYIRSALSGKNLEVYSYSTVNGGRLTQWDNTAGNNQQWTVVLEADGSYILKNRHSGKLAEVAGLSRDNAAGVQQWDSWNGANQKFRIERVR